jgi:malate permease and related proteins
MDFFGQAGFLFGTVLLPILLIVAAGALVQRSHPLEMGTLSKIQIYLFVPVFLFYYVYTSTLGGREMLGIVGACLLAQWTLGLPLLVFLHRRKVRKEAFAVILLSATLFNAGNFGVPVAVRAYGEAGGAVQALLVMVANLSLWALGYGLMASMTGRGAKSAIIGYFRLPMFYLLVLAFVLRGFHITLPEPILYSAKIVAQGLVPLALLTLGAQLARQARWPRWRAVLPVVFLKLLVLPAVTAGVVLLLGLWPWPGAMIIVASAGPSAVNTLLLAMEQDGDVELAADCVFWTTLFSAVTVTITLAVVQSLGGYPPTGTVSH